MTTKIKEPEFRAVLRDARGGRSKAEMARVLDVEWMTYDMWEKGAWVPSDDQAEKLAGVVDRDLPAVVWMLYRARIRARGVLLASISRGGPLAMAS